MQNSEKYKKDYRESLKKLAADRRQLVKELDSVPYLRPIPSQANYVMCEVTEGRTSREIACELLKHDICLLYTSPAVEDRKAEAGGAVNWNLGPPYVSLIKWHNWHADGADAHPPRAVSRSSEGSFFPTD